MRMWAETWISNSEAVGGNYSITQACVFVERTPQNIHKKDFTYELMDKYHCRR